MGPSGSFRPGAAEIEPDRARAIDRLIGLAAPGDLVLLTGKGRRASQEIERTIAPLDDRRQQRIAAVAVGESGTWFTGQRQAAAVVMAGGS